jgi:CheY-like chemotaxis protein
MKSVLVAEADCTLASALTFLLHKSGFTVAVAHDYSAAMQCLQSTSPPSLIVLLDYAPSMPLAHALLTRLKDDGALHHLRILLLSGGVKALLAPLHDLIAACQVTILSQPTSWAAVVPVLEQMAREEE